MFRIFSDCWGRPALVAMITRVPSPEIFIVAR
jgi:hypothetical protein